MLSGLLLGIRDGITRCLRFRDGRDQRNDRSQLGPEGVDIFDREEVEGFCLLGKAITVTRQLSPPTSHLGSIITYRTSP